MHDCIVNVLGEEDAQGVFRGEKSDGHRFSGEAEELPARSAGEHGAID
jgi:hypothetical protein